MSDDDQDMQEAAEHEQMLTEQRRREDNLLAGAPAQHAELARIRRETDETLRMMNFAIDCIFRDVRR